MDFYELKNKYFSLVRKKMINDYKMGNMISWSRRNCSIIS